MNGIVKVALIGGGAYLLYRMLSSQASTPATPAPATTPTGSQTTQPVQQAASTATRDLVYSTAKNNLPGSWPGQGTLNADQWNYYYQQATGKPGPDPLVVWPTQNRSTMMTVDQWWAGVSAHGVSGLGNYAIFARGLGTFAPMNLDRRPI